MSKIIRKKKVKQGGLHRLERFLPDNHFDYGSKYRTVQTRRKR